MKSHCIIPNCRKMVSDIEPFCSDHRDKKASKSCPCCDGTGDVHRADGEWLGECDCKKGTSQ